MKKLLFVISLFLNFFGIAQVSTTRINDINLGMDFPELENLIGQKLELKFNGSNYPEGALAFIYNDIAYKVRLCPNRNESVANDFYVCMISSSDPSLKTLSGIKVGSNLYELISKYKDYNISISDSYDENTNKRTKALRYFYLNDYDAKAILQCDIVDGKVALFTITYNEYDKDY